MKNINISQSNTKRFTVANKIQFNGKGLHFGSAVSIVINPAKAGDGIVFVRTDIKDKNNKIKADFNNVTDLKFNTTISNADGVGVSTVEHLLAALWDAKISDCIVEVNSSELPIMDGSSLVFLNGLKTVIKTELNQHMPLATVQNTINIADGVASIIAMPPLYNGQLMVDFTIEFNCKEVGLQKFVFEPSAGDSFASEISHAKTFAIKKDYDYLKSIGYAKGGDETNGILLEEDKIYNPQMLTYKDDFIRHKILDFLGDLYTSGHLFSGRFICNKSGHKTSNMLLKELFS